MTALEFNKVLHQGVLSREVALFDVVDDIQNLSYYVISNTSYYGDDHRSRERRQIYWFPWQSARRGDKVQLFTGDGENALFVNDDGTTTYDFYWKLRTTVWQQKGEYVLLFHVSTWSTHLV